MKFMIINETPKRKNDHVVASRSLWLQHQGERVALQERWQNDWQDIKYEGTIAKASPCPERWMRTPLPQQSSSSNKKGKPVELGGR